MVSTTFLVWLSLLHCSDGMVADLAASAVDSVVQVVQALSATN